MVEESVVTRICQRICRRGYESAATNRQNATHLTERSHVVSDVLDDIRRYDEVKCGIGERQMAQIAYRYAIVAMPNTGQRRGKVKFDADRIAHRPIFGQVNPRATTRI